MRSEAGEIGSVPFGEAVRAWAYVGLNSFGGPAGQIAVMHSEIVDRRAWIDEPRFLHALNYVMLLPGPEAQQLATYIGWLLHGYRGGVVAGFLFVLPGAIVLLALSILYAGFFDTAIVQALFYGIKPAVVALVAVAVVRLAKRALKGRAQVAIAVLAFAAMFFLDIPFPLVIGAAALAGLLLARGAGPLHEVVEESNPAVVPAQARRERVRHSVIALAIGLVLWLAPTALLALVLGPSTLLTQLAFFFSVAAVVTFGGAYAVLAFVAQQAVDVYGWLTPGQMLDGLGLAETTPGPLIMVVQFVGFMAAFSQPAGLDPFVAGTLGALLVTWVTFVPSFVFIFVGAPHVEALRHVSWLSAALAGVTAAVAGVIANLAAWFALQTLFGVNGEYRLGPLRLHTVELASVDLFAVVLAVLAFVALVRLRWSLLLTLAISAAFGSAWFLLR